MKYFDGYCDSEIGRFDKENWTFERVADIERERFPHGVNMTYRAYSQDEVFEIVDDRDQQSITSLIPQLTLCHVSLVLLQPAWSR